MRKHVRTLLLLFVAVLAIVAVSMVWAGPRPDGRNDNDDKKEFQGRGDNDRDGWRDDRRGFRNDDDWDDHDNFHHRESYAIGLWGDLPYSDLQANPGVNPNLILDMNSQHLAFTIHDGDLKAGNGLAGSASPTTCEDAKYVQAKMFLDMLKAPAAFTPGDNDWTDCDTPSNNPPDHASTTVTFFNSLERLDHERGLFFNTSFSFGQHHLRQAVQTMTTQGVSTPCLGFLDGTPTHTDHYKNVACVENRRWTYRGVTYATMNIQGSCDNRCKTNPDNTEADARQKADIAWMKETFQVAKDRDSAAVMLISQADPGFSNRPTESEPSRDPKTLVCSTTGTGACNASTPDGFQAFLTALREEVIRFDKPVAYVHGDTHYFRIDRPFLDSKGQRLEKFIRIETFGDNVFTTDATKPDPGDLNNVHWVKAFVDPDSREVFSFQPQTVPGNVVVHPIP